MSEALGLTVSIATVREVARKALATTDGLTLAFTIARYGSLEAANARARSFQTSFSSLRARERRLVRNAPNAGTIQRYDEAGHGSLDQLSCTKLPRANGDGWDVVLARSSATALDLEIYDRATGEEITAFSADEARESAITKAIAQAMGKRKADSTALLDWPCTIEDYRFYRSRNPEYVKHIHSSYGFKQPVGFVETEGPRALDVGFDIPPLPAAPVKLKKPPKGFNAKQHAVDVAALQAKPLDEFEDFEPPETV